MRRIEALAARIAATSALGLTAMFGLTGCCYYELRDMCDECSLNIRNEYLSRKAWYHCGGSFENHPHAKQFGHGFRDGYSAVAAGGDGCAPPMPPRCYWSCCNSGCDGQMIVNAYFDGYARGAVAAEADGLAASSRIAFRKPACGPNYSSTGYGAGGLVPTPSGPVPTAPSGPAVGSGPPSPPPPAPPALTPAPTIDGYEGSTDGGLYYE